MPESAATTIRSTLVYLARVVWVGVVAWVGLIVLVPTHADTPDGIMVVTRAGIASQPDASRWREISLPHRWDLEHYPEGDSLWYRVLFDAERLPDSSLAVYVPKASMTADLRLNGAPVDDRAGPDDVLPRHWNTPLLFRLPDRYVQAGTNELLIRVRAEPRHDGGLSTFLLGPVDRLEPLAGKAHFWRVQLVGVTVTTVLALGLVAAIIWIRWRSRIEYGYFALGALGCAVSSLNMIVVHPPVSDASWEVLIHGALHGGVLCLALFAWHLSGTPTHRLRRVALAILVLDVTVMAVLPDALHRPIVSTFSLVVFATAAAALIPLIGYLRRQPMVDSLVFGFAAVLGVAIGAHDWLKISGWLPYEWPFALQYVWPVLLTGFAWLVAGDYARTQRELAALNHELNARVQARELALEASYQELHRAEQAEAAAQERARILRDMHDGVGAHLSTAVRLLEAGQSPVEAVTGTLRDALDQLKLSIDGLSIPPGDVNALLANLRYRLERRLRDAGLDVAWNVAPLPLWTGGLGDRQMQQLQYVLFELIANVLQHADARHLTITAAAADDRIEIAIVDDGRGIAENTRPRAASARAAGLGAVLRSEALARGSRMVIALPLHGPALATLDMPAGTPAAASFENHHAG